MFLAGHYGEVETHDRDGMSGEVLEQRRDGDDDRFLEHSIPDGPAALGVE